MTGQNGAGGIRTPKSSRTHAFEACAIAILPPLQTTKPGLPSTCRGNPGEGHGCHLPIGAPGFEPGTSASRTQRSTGLSHAPHLPDGRRRQAGRIPTPWSSSPTTGWDAANFVRWLRGPPVRAHSRITPLAAPPNPLWVLLRSPRGFESRPSCLFNGRGGIRTHAGFHPHDFQSCALSHSATRPEPLRRGWRGPASPRRRFS